MLPAEQRRTEPPEPQGGTADMPHVFTGSVVVPGEQFQGYLHAMAEAEDARAPFRRSLEARLAEFGAALAAKYTRKTVRQHVGVVEAFIAFLCDYTDVERLEEVTRGMVNSHFQRWYRRKVWDDTDSAALRVALRRFFQFLRTSKGIHNPQALAALT